MLTKGNGNNPRCATCGGDNKSSPCAYPGEKKPGCLQDPARFGPDPEEIKRITNIIVTELGDCDIPSALTVVCGLAGQLAASLSEGNPTALKAHIVSISASIQKAGIDKLIYDYDNRNKSNGR